MKTIPITFAACSALLGCSLVGNAASINVGLRQFTGDPARINVNISDDIGGGDLKFTVSLVTSGGGVTDGDISAFWAHINDESLLAGLSLSDGSETLGTLFTGANSINNLPGGGGQNLNGGSPAGAVPFDLGFKIGDSNGNDDIESFMFTMSHTTEALELSDFEGAWLGARLQSTGGRAGSSKLVGRRPPGTSVSSTGTTAAFMLMGVGALAGARRRLGVKR